MVWFLIHVRILLKTFRLEYFPKVNNPKGRHWQGKSVMEFPEIAQRFVYYKSGHRTYKMYTGGYSRLEVA